MTNDSAVVGGGQANFCQTDVAVSAALRRPAVGTDFETKTELKSKKSSNCTVTLTQIFPRRLIRSVQS